MCNIGLRSLNFIPEFLVVLNVCVVYWCLMSVLLTVFSIFWRFYYYVFNISFTFLDFVYYEYNVYYNKKQSPEPIFDRH